MERRLPNLGKADVMTTQAEEPRNPRFRKSTLGLLLATALLTAVAFIVGISDNPPGIALLYAAGLTLVLAAAHRWRKPRAFGLLLLASVIGFFLTAVIHNFAEVGAERIAHIPILSWPLAVIGVVGFFMAIIICPMGVVVGAVGAVVTALRNDLKPA
jgi:hypothetical protein